MKRVLDWWTPMSSVMSAFLDVLPKPYQDRVIEQLQALAKVAADAGGTTTEYFARELYGEFAGVACLG